MKQGKEIKSLLTKNFPTLNAEEIERAMTLKYYEDSILMDNNEIVELLNYDIQNPIDTGFSIKLPNRNNVYYYNDKFNNHFYFIEGSKHKIQKNYLDKLKVIDVSINYSIAGDIKVTPFIVEYRESEIIEILETENNKISFQPNNQTEEYEVLFKIEGEGVLYNFIVNSQSRKREVLGQTTIHFDKDDFFMDQRLINANYDNHDEYLNLSVLPNQQKHIYVSYLERNNKYTIRPTHCILDEINLESNILVEFNILKDVTLDFLPMLIEYDEKGKIGIKNLNIYNPEIIRLKTNTKNVRLAFRITGYGELKIKDLNVISLEALPNNPRLNFEDRSEVIKLLSPTLRLNEFKIAGIMDEFTFNSFEPEVQLHRLDDKKWKSEILFTRPDLIFIESAWNGNNGKWYRKVAYYDDEQHKDIKNLIKFSQDLNIPVVFWNKEDPVHYNRFIETAKLCDYVFTTDEGRIKQYILDCGHTNVKSLPFAAQPENHNPIKIQKERDPRVSFAGSYYRHHEERSKDMDVLLEASKEIGLVIYDRNFEKTRNGQMPNHQFPERFQPYIKGTLPFNLIDKSYKGFKYMINVNTVKYSETMFSRRVFEGLLSGTPIISTYSLGMKKMFGDIINASSKVEDLIFHLNRLNSSDELYNKYAVRGIREILLNHTYEHRMKKVLNEVGYTILSNKINVYFIGFVETDDDIEKYISIFKEQTVSNKKLIIIHKCIKNYEKFYNNFNNEYMIGIDYKALNKYINIKQLLGNGYLLVLNKNHFYAKNYALDLILARKYSKADIIGKSMYYSNEKNALKIKNKNYDYIYTNNVKVDRSAINISIFDKFSIESTLDYLEKEEGLSSLTPFGAKIFSVDSLNFIEFGNDYCNKERVEI